MRTRSTGKMSVSRKHSSLGTWSRAIACAAGALLIISVSTVLAQTVPPFPTVEGPITGPGPMFPGIRPGPEGTNLDDFDYIVEEFFISGTAAGQPYKTRILLRRPANINKFSGIVVAEPMHRGGNALICQFARFGIGQRGHACLEIAARPINLNNNNNPDQSLQPFNAARYGDFSILANQTNEIIAQVGRLIKSNLAGGPLFPYYVEHIVLTGTSDSSAATRTYQGSAHATFRMPDGNPIYEGYFVSSTLGGAPVAITDVPAIQMPTQFEVHGTNAYRRPDSDLPGNRFRIFEVAGMSHNDARENPAFPGCDHPELSQFPYGAITFVGLQHLIDWVADGTAPPHADYMEVDNDTSDGTRVALDEFGNAKGGVRTTYLDVPIYTYTIPNSGPGLCNQTGYQTPLSDDVLRLLYKNRGEYVSQVEQRLMDLIREGWFPKEYADAYVRGDLKDADIPNPGN
jgi:hypothetical protein